MPRGISVSDYGGLQVVITHSVPVANVQRAMHALPKDFNPSEQNDAVDLMAGLKCINPNFSGGSEEVGDKREGKGGRLTPAMKVLIENIEEELEAINADSTVEFPVLDTPAPCKQS